MVEPAAFPHAAAFSGAGLEIEADPETESGGRCVIRGNTFRYKDILKAHGGRWSKSRSAWMFDDLAMIDRLGQELAGGDGAAPGLAEAPLLFAQASAGEPVPARRSDRSQSDPRRYHDHRERLRTRFMNGDGNAMPDYELLELLLFFSIRYVDVKPLAKTLLAEFGSLGGITAAEPTRLEHVLLSMEGRQADRIAMDSHFTIVHLKAIQSLLRRIAAEGIHDRPVISSWQALLDYLKVALGHESIEQFCLLFLDKKNVLIRNEAPTRPGYATGSAGDFLIRSDQVQQTGTVDHTPLYPREIAKRALELNASAVIMVHNHPSGDPTPSRADIEMTKQVEAALAPIRVTLHDHLIIGKDRHLSFKSEGLL